MLFTQIEFLILFISVLALIFLIKGHKAQKMILLAASWYFYAYWDWRFFGLLLLSTVVDYSIGMGFAKITDNRKRRVLLWVSVITNLGILGFFKYYNFFIGSISQMLQPLGINTSTLSIILPIGISFYTFQTMSYTIDVYWRKLEPCKNFFDFALFVSFFPQLVAGPIVRASDFLPQLKTPRQMSWDKTYSGARLIVIGFFKKSFIADHLAFFVDGVFRNPGVFDMGTTWLAVLAYAIQIYCDFSGYSDMAIGLARILGYEFNINFNLPYLAHSVEDFWRRWHISLSTWLRDYLYIPLGGNRKGRTRTYLNLIITMVLGGLWHGAAWTFVFWGAIHGGALAVSKFYSQIKHDAQRRVEGAGFRRFTGWAATMLVVIIGWTFFRAQSFSDAVVILHKMFVNPAGIAWYPSFAVFTIAGFGIYYLTYALKLDWIPELSHHPRYSPVLLWSMVWVTVLFYPKNFQPFIYFQF